MSADDPELRRMLGLYKQERAPQASVQERVWSAVTSELAPSARAPDASEPSEAPASSAPQVSPTPWMGKALVVAALIAVGGVAWMSWPMHAGVPSSEEREGALAASAAPASTSTSTPHASLPPSPTLGAPAAAASSAAAAQAAGRREAREARVPDSTLALELALLTKAQSSIDAGQYAAALRTLRRHGERFPSGALAEERDAASVEVLCELGRSREARGAADAFRARFPDSPRVARVSKLCAAEQTP